MEDICKRNNLVATFIHYRVASICFDGPVIIAPKENNSDLDNHGLSNIDTPNGANTNLDEPDVSTYIPNDSDRDESESEKASAKESDEDDLSTPRYPISPNLDGPPYILPHPGDGSMNQQDPTNVIKQGLETAFIEVLNSIRKDKEFTSSSDDEGEITS